MSMQRMLSEPIAPVGTLKLLRCVSVGLYAFSTDFVQLRSSRIVEVRAMRQLIMLACCCCYFRFSYGPCHDSN